MSEIISLEEAQERAMHGIGKALEDAAEARARAEELDERRKQVKAAMVVHYRDEGNGIAEAQERAMASAPYKEAAEQWIAANYDYRRSDAKVERSKLAFEAWRTMNATRRAEMNLR
jgi:hypothetical protein